MARRINWLNQALRELFHHCHRLEKTSPERSIRLEQEAFQSVEILKEFPLLGRAVPEVVPEHRALLIFSQSYWIIYRVRTKMIVIAAVVSTLQDFTKAWESRKRT